MSFTCGHTLHKMLTELAAYLDGFVSREAYDAVVKERDDLRLYAAQCSLNADNANISLGCACEELKEMREAFGLVSTLAPLDGKAVTVTIQSTETNSSKSKEPK